MYLKEIAQILAKEFKPQGYSVPTLGCPTFATKMIGFINKDIKAMLPHVGKVNKIENTRVRNTQKTKSHHLNDMDLFKFLQLRFEVKKLLKRKKFLMGN